MRSGRLSRAEKTARYHGPLNEPTYLRLKKSGLRYAMRVQGRDYDVLGWPRRRLGLVTILVLSAGILILVRTWRRAVRDSRSAATVPAIS